MAEAYYFFSDLHATLSLDGRDQRAQGGDGCELDSMVHSAALHAAADLHFHRICVDAEQPGGLSPPAIVGEHQSNRLEHVVDCVESAQLLATSSEEERRVEKWWK